MDITYIARAPVCCTISTDSRRYDEIGIIVSNTSSIAYDLHLNPIQSWTDTTTCKENGLV